MITRETLIETLRAALEPLPFVHAMWIGGSESFGASDAFSDVDAMVVSDRHVDEIFATVERALERMSPIAHRLRLPEPAWHGHSQTFYRLEGTPEWLMIDLAIMQHDTKGARFNEIEIHGRARVLFDKTGAAEPTSFDRQAHSRKIAARRSAIAARHALFSHTVEKELARGHSHDALLFHQRFVVDPLVELLRMRHCPERFDFGARYLWRDLPTDVAARVERLAFVCDRDDLDRKRQEGIAWIAELLAQDASASAG